jgi:hypothetical protein
VAPVTPRSGREDLRWLLEVVWGGGDLDGRDGDEAYLALPGLDHPRFLVPASSRRASAGMLARYNRMRRPSTRAARRGAAMAARAGLLSLAGARVAVRSEGSLVEHLRRVLGRDDVQVAAGIRRRGLLTKPVLQLFDPSGRPVGYAKVGWNDVTRAAVANEARALDEVGAAGPRAFRVPRLLWTGAWRETIVTVVEPLPSEVRRHPADRPPPVRTIDELARLGGTERMALSATPWLARARHDLAAADTGSLADRIERDLGDVTVEVGGWHGDLTPWNLAWSGRDPFVIDWEHAGRDVPVGLDVVHFHFQVAFVLERHDVAEAHRIALARSAPALRALGLEEPAAAALGPIHLAELVLRTAEAARSGAAPSPRLYEPLRALARGPGVEVGG